MEIIKPLPESVRSSVRSGFIISDMIRVVEELVYNSLDACATKVLVSVGVGTGYVKVEDNGCGISRDGLALLGERYATSKNQTFPDTSDVLRSFGSHGEVLCSIADVSLLEIITKAKGRPNGYRKTMKGAKCLYLGIDDDRWDTGTTVIVHDMFYNQPVRRMHMQTSPKKVLHSIKKCVLQIAIVRPQVSFSIVDIESEDVLLRTRASSSPLALLISHFGIKVTLLHELGLSEDSFELAGYISSSPESFSTKGIQYIYVNLRFIDRSPIHKLLNGLASTCWEQLNNNQGGKRSRPQVCATYCLNLTCPRYLYDLNVEQLKTSVEFKDWLPVLSLIEKTVASLWKSIACNGKLFSSTANPRSKHHARKEADTIKSTRIDADLLDTYEIPNKRCKIQNDQSSQPALYSSFCFPMEAGTPELRQSSYYQDREEVRRPSVGELRDDSYWRFPSSSYNHSADCTFPVMDCTCIHSLDITDKVPTVNEDQNMSPIRSYRSSVHDCFSSEEMAESPVRIMAEYARNKVETSPEVLPFQFEDDTKLFWQKQYLPESENCTIFRKCSSLENLHDVSFNTKERFEFQRRHHETDREYIDPRGDEFADIDNELIPSHKDFTEGLLLTRKYDSFLEDRVCSQEMDDYPRMFVANPRSNEADPSSRNYLPSRYQDVSGLFLHNCSSLKNTNEFIGEKWFEFQSADGVKRVGSVKFHGDNEHADEFQRTVWQDDVSNPFPFNESKSESVRSKVPLFGEQEYSAAGHDKCHSGQEIGGFGTSFGSSDNEYEDMNSDSFFGVKSWDFEHRSLEEQGMNVGSRNHANLEYFKHEKKNFGSSDFDDVFSYEDHLSKGHSNTHLGNGCEKDNRDTDDSYRFGQRLSDKLSASQDNNLDRETDFACPQTYKGFPVSSLVYGNPSIDIERTPKIHQPRSGVIHGDVDKARRKRSHSAPPVYGGKRKITPLNTSSTSVVENPDKRFPTGGCENKTEQFIQKSSLQWDHSPETNPKNGFPVYTGRKMKEAANMPVYSGKKKIMPLNTSFTSVVANPDKRFPTVIHLHGGCENKKEKFIQKSSSQWDHSPETNPKNGFPVHTGRKMKEAANMPVVAKIEKGKKLESPSHAYDIADLGVKWSNGYPQAESDYLHNPQTVQIRGKSLNCQDKYSILDVSSGILHLASDTIVPKSISRKCLQASKVLLQIDKKFIPVISGKVLAVIDQHAADERIRLEELRDKVLSGEKRTVAYLEEEKEMMLPENVYQLLHYYAHQIKHWGWICNIFRDSQSFTTNFNLLHKQPASTIILIAVPCILGVKLSEADLLEFVEQLADTDGSSTVPPSAVRILNSKACRGAIMFGDKLLPSECSLIVEELKRTSLCFQCAHGRPTMAPLVNLEALHKQIEKLGLYKGSSKPWHGLNKQAITLERAKQRLGTN